MDQRRSSRRPRVLVIAMVVAVVSHGLLFLFFGLPSYLKPPSVGNKQPSGGSQPAGMLHASDASAAAQTGSAPSVENARRTPKASLAQSSSDPEAKPRQPNGRETSENSPSSEPHFPFGRILQFDAEPNVPAYLPVGANDATEKPIDQSAIESARPTKALRLFPAR